MTLIEFNALDEPMQYLVLLEFGVCVSHREVNKYTYVLYQVDNFYAEVMYADEQKEILAMNVFSDTRLLEPYLDQISLPDFK